MKFYLKNLGISLLILASSMSAYSQNKNVEKNRLNGNYSIQIDKNVTNNKGGHFSISFDSAENSIEKFIPSGSQTTIISKGSLGQPRVVDITYIPTNDSSVNTFNSFEKKIEPKNILSMKFYCTPRKNVITIRNGKLALTKSNLYQKEYIHYLNILDTHVKTYIDPILKQYNEVARTNDSSQIKKLALEYQRVNSDSFEAAKVDYPFIEAHPNSPVSLYLLSLAYSNNNINKIEHLLNGLSPEIQKLPTAINISNLIQNARTNAIGKLATNFTLTDTSNHKISLSDYKGKYVLIDFWASWCAPCRAENPNVVKAFNTFRNKNFTIISISLDDNRQNWVNAVKNDHLDWAQLSELKGWDGKVSSDYAVTAIPTNYLVDPSGKIIAKNLRGKELETTLDKYLK